MQQACPDKKLLEAPTGGEGATCRSCTHCPWMAMNDLKAIADGLKQRGEGAKFWLTMRCVRVH